MGELVDVDLEHLRLLKLCYYILAGTISLLTLFSLFYLMLGGVMASGLLPTGTGSGDPETAGMIFLAIGGFMMLIGVAVSLMNWWTGRCLRDRRHRVFCLVSAALSLVNMPFGTAIGIGTFMVLNRPSVRALFEQQGPTA